MSIPISRENLRTDGAAGTDVSEDTEVTARAGAAAGSEGAGASAESCDSGDDSGSGFETPNTVVSSDETTSSTTF